jgi:hypothetical protein
MEAFGKRTEVINEIKRANRMSTNYYLHEYVSTDPKILHIGKSSGGWCFSLHVVEEGVHTH